MNILVIGTGWYGCHIANILKSYNINVILVDKSNDFFNGSSSKNQNRLHLGYHYPRSKETIDECIEGYKLFMDKYKFLCNNVDDNMYFISENNSLISFDKFIELFNCDKLYDNNSCKPFKINNSGNLHIKVEEKYIDHNKAKEYFKSLLNDKLHIINNLSIFNSISDIINYFKNNNIIFDYIINCTYNHLNPIDFDKYELFMSLKYNIETKYIFAYTIMDGPFYSLYPYDLQNNEYTLTSVTHGILWEGTNKDNLYNDIEINNIINNKREIIEKNIINYLPNFFEHAKYSGYNLSWKTKPISNTDDRSIRILKQDNIINVYGGKITGIFALEKYILSLI